MSSQKSKGSILPPLQRRIILCLADGGLQTINEITSNIPLLKLAKVCHYKPTWMAVKWLGKKGLVREAGKKEYRGREYPQFWLTSDGVLVALTEGAPLERLLARTKEIYPKDETLACYLEVVSRLNPDIIRLAYSALRRKGKIEPIDLATILFAEMQTDTSIQVYREIVKTIRSYPKEYEAFKRRMEKALETISKFNEMT